MGFVKKTWKDRISQYPNRRTINDGIVTKTVTVGRDEGEVTEEGDAFSASAMNDLERRIYNAIEQGGGGGGGGGGHTIIDNEGVSLTQRSGLQFKGAYSDDNETDDITEVNIVRNMTKAEFDLLPAEEKVGLINITDITSSHGDRFQPVLCSEEEQEIGVWINGKPLYKRTIVKSFNDRSTTLAITFTDYFPSSYYIEGIFDYSIILKASDSGSWVIPNYDPGGNVKITTFSVVSCNLSRSQGTAWGNTPTVYLTIYYSKTDDTAGSGKWTPQGLPTVHYSTDEQIVGTWIDGRTVYEKTLNVGAITSGTTFAHGITNLDWIIDYSLFGLYGGGNAKLVSPANGSSSSIGFVISNWDSTNITFTKGNLSSDFSDCYCTIRYIKSST